MVNPRWLFLCRALLLLLFAKTAYADGAYQRTTDQKTFVWNPDPRPEDAAIWSGDRDAGRYATGYGTLTWYKVVRKSAIGSRFSLEKQTPVVRYSGKMVQGKLEGVVVAVDEKGKTSHATFADGSRSDEWAAGPGPSSLPDKSVSPRRPDRTNIASEPPSPGSSESVRERSGAIGPPSPDPATTGRREEPAPKPAPKPDEAVQRGAVAEVPVEAPSPTASPIPDQQRSDKSARREVVEDIPAEGPSAVASPAPAPIPEHPPSPSLGATGSPLQSDSESVRERSGATKQTNQRITNRPPKAMRGNSSEFLRSLVLPPSALGSRMDLLAATSPPPATPATSSSLTSGPHLSTAEVIGMADAEAITQGYDLGSYQRPKVDYIAADDVWSVLYDQKPMDGKAQGGKHFSVTIEDKTKKTFIGPGR